MTHLKVGVERGVEAGVKLGGVTDPDVSVGHVQVAAAAVGVDVVRAALDVAGFGGIGAGVVLEVLGAAVTD